MSKGTIVGKGSPGEILPRIEWLKEVGLDAPRVTELLWRLRLMGADVTPKALTLDDACENLYAAIKHGAL
jgi:biotin transport system ATP-binding protein/energy-coupling factor transport system ATP-binding protein